MSIKVKDLIEHLQKIDPEIVVFKRAGGAGSGVYEMDSNDFSAAFYQGFIDKSVSKNGKYEFDFMSAMEEKQGAEITNKNAIKVVAL